MSRRGIYAAALVVAAAAVEVVHRPAVTTYCHAGRRCRGGRGLDKRCWADETCNVAPNPFDAPRAAHVRPAAAPGNPVAYRTHAERVAQRRREWMGLDVSNREDKKLLRAKKGPFGSTLAFKDGGEIARRFGAAASSVGAIVDTVVLADAAYYVGVEIVVGSRSRCDSFRTGTTSATRACRRSTELW